MKKNNGVEVMSEVQHDMSGDEASASNIYILKTVYITK